MASVLLSRRDLDFLLHEWLQVDLLTKRERYAEHDRATFDAVLDLAERIATEQFAPHNAKADAHEPQFVDGRVEMIPEVKQALRVFNEAGFVGAGMPADIGGMQLPASVVSAAFAWFQAANVGTSSYPFLTIGNANLLLAYGTPEQVQTWVPRMIAGEVTGTMCLSEPQAGSSLADVATRAVPGADGTWLVTGNKMWISGGDHELSDNIVHLVLARTPGAPAGVKGLSLFLVPRVLADGTRNDVTLAGLNHKMGWRGTTNTLLNFGEHGGAVGELVGTADNLGRGLACMFHMMNEARVGVGMGATALGYTGYLRSLDYARTRPQGRPVLGREAAAPQVPIVEHADVRRMLLAQKSYVEGSMALILFCSSLLDEEQTADTEEARAEAHLLLDTITPIAKSWPSQWCLEANSLAIQVHGGYGYTREYAVEQLYRDNRLNPIHEGTHGIQGLDLLGRKVVIGGGAGLALLLGRLRATAGRGVAAGAELETWGTALAAVAQRIEETTVALWSAGDVEATLANASAYLEAVGHAVLAWIWLEQALVADGQTGAFYEGKLAATRYFYAHELPRTGPQLDLLARVDRTTLDTDPAWL